MASLSVGAAPNIVQAGVPAARLAVVSLTLSPAAVGTNVEQTFTLNGLLPGDVILAVNKPTYQSGIGITGFRVTAANTLGITFTGSGTPTASEVYQVVCYRPAYVTPLTSFEG